MTALNYRPDIDGLRAVAVIPVVLYHAELGFSGGYIGVDVFFVISGFLITSLILKGIDSGTFSIVEFWSRRVRRIIPAVSVLMAACLVAGWFIFWPDDYRDLGYSAAAQSTFVSNVWFWMQSGYFEDPSSVKPLLHTWSLSVEEQFYLVFPAMLLIIAGWNFTRRVWLIFGIALASFMMAVYGSYQHPSATFYLIPTRAWELLAGSLLAMLGSQVNPGSDRVREVFSWGGIAMIGYSAAFYDDQTRFPGLAAVLPVMGTVFIVWSNSVRLTSLGRVLSWQPLVFIGLISYSWYLWHWPLLVFVQYWSLDDLAAASRISLVLISILLATLSWKWVELPFRRKSVTITSGGVIARGALALLTVSVSGYVVAKSNGVSFRVPPEAAVFAAGKKDRAFTDKLTLVDALNGNFVPLGSNNVNDPVHTLVWGDSHAMAVMPAIDSLCTRHGVRCFGAAHSSTAPLLDFESHTTHGLKEGAVLFNDAVLDFVRREQVKNVVLVALWRGYGLEQDEEEFRRLLHHTAERIHQSGAQAWVMLEVPSHDVDVPRALARATLAGMDITNLGVSLKEQADKTRWQESVFSSIGEDLRVLNPFEYLAGQSGHCQVAENGRSLYSDNHHLSIQGAMKIRPMFEPLFLLNEFPSAITENDDRVGRPASLEF